MSEGTPDRAETKTAGGGDPQHFGVALRRMLGEMNRLVHGFALTQRLHPTDVHALSFVLDNPDATTPGLLREHLGLTSGAVTACLDRLEKAGHIRRSRADDDRRVVHIHYVEGARSVARAYFMPLAQAADRARGQFTEDELAVVLRYLDALNDELGELRVPQR
ncbi:MULTISPECIES: MarR family winged helix-turn-helix transcriptional regulator [Streptomyces]|uniref:MarR family winged helix-turn-helix transcriptional regulator n=1 Tax=Streptomyces solicathayae TaxID=3081768 RepID=A0ABZ0LN50_9ACTN|nr:MarR family winged helix-turn-helix transcriptional regulator [Streptomyces sp. HUAS YS2]WOX20866.1 MarR family winged helix-turn-helix transcriptional regulator [Streptomyces sp. HUAS YS2]